MPFSIRNQKAELLARALAATTGETLTQAVIKALDERLLRIQKKRAAINLLDEIMHITDRYIALPLLDNRSPEEILGYDDKGGF